MVLEKRPAHNIAANRNSAKDVQVRGGTRYPTKRADSVATVLLNSIPNAPLRGKYLQT